MATFKAEVIPCHMRQDKTWNVKIRITHNRGVKRVSTPWYVTADQMTRGYKIKDQRVLALLDETIRTYRERFAALGMGAASMDIDRVVSAVVSDDYSAGIPFFPFAEQFIRQKSSPGVYRNAVNSFRDFMGVHDVTFQDITSRSIRAWMQSLKPKTARNLFGRLKHIYESGKAEYNDEDNARILIPNNPFARVELPKDDEPAKKKAVSPEVIRMVAMVPDNTRANSTLNIARDMFLLSFCMIGMNAADIYDMKVRIAGNAIAYERKKTRERRSDRAYIKVDIPAIAKPIVEEYRGQERTFCVHARYSDSLVFDNQLSKGMKKLAREVMRIYRFTHPKDRRSDVHVMEALNIKDFKFYAARHSWATIARNDLAVGKWDVHEALNHVDKDTRIDDTYITKDFRIINEANKAVMDYVFGPIVTAADEVLRKIDIAAKIFGSLRP